MCGRFGLTDPQAVRGFFELIRTYQLGDGVNDLLVPRFNIAPSRPVLGVRTRVPGRSERGQPERRVDVFKWGLVPHWSRNGIAGNRTSNACAETIAERASYRDAWRAGRRCLIPADVLYEWEKLPGREHAKKAPTQPYAVRMRDNALFCFGGLWDAWRDPAAGKQAPWKPTCTIITTTPNDVMAAFHHRMPVIIPAEHIDAWLDPALPLDEARALLVPYAPDAMRAYRITRTVNAPANEGPGVLEPAEEREC